MKKPEVAMEVAVPLGTGTNTVPARRPCPGNAADRGYGNSACPRLFRRPRAAGTIGGRSATGTVELPDMLAERIVRIEAERVDVRSHPATLGALARPTQRQQVRPLVPPVASEAESGLI